MVRVACRWAAAVLFLPLLGCSFVPVWTDGEVPFVATPPEVIDRMLEMVQVRPGDVVYDLGSGDGAIVIRAAKKYGVKAVGIEIDPDLVRKARDNAAKENVTHLVEFRVEDALAADVSSATIVTLYMLPEFNAKLRPSLERQLNPGARVVAHDYPIDGWLPERVERVKGHWLHDHTLLLFNIPPRR